MKEKPIRINTIEELQAFAEKHGITVPKKLGEEGTAQIVTINGVVTDNAPFFKDFSVSLDWGNGEPKPFVMRSNIGGDGAIFIPIMGDKIALVKQWRPTLGEPTIEVPRGFSEEWKNNEHVSAKTLPKGFHTAIREIRADIEPETMLEVAPVGNFAENSGTHTGSPEVFIIRIPEGELGGTDENTSVLLVDTQGIYEMIANGTIRDAHSLSAIAIASAQGYLPPIQGN